jgi:hypothetical protein
MTGEGAARTRVAERDLAALRRQRWDRLAQQMRDAADTLDRASAALDDPYLADVARSVRLTAVHAEERGRD